MTVEVIKFSENETMAQIPDKVFEQHIAILGKTGSGKTYTAKGIVERLLDNGARCCIIDPTGVWWGLKSSATGKRGAYPAVVFGGSHADVQLSPMHGDAIAEIIGTSSTPSIVDTSLLKVGERTRFFTDFANTLLQKNIGPLHLIIDEAHLFAPQGKVPDPQSGQMLNAANNLVSLGRSRGLRIVLITQRPAKLHKDSLTQVEALIAMRLIAPQDRRAVEDWIEDQADTKRGEAIIASLPTLKTGNGWVWAPEINMLKCMRFPTIKTFDSSMAPSFGDKKTGPILAPIDLQSIQSRLEEVAHNVFANDPARLKKRIAELETDARKKAQPEVDSESINKAYDEGYKKGSIEGFKEGKLVAAGEMQKCIAGIHDAFLQPKKKSHDSRDARPAPATPVKRAAIASLPVASDLPNPQRRILRSLHFWHSVAQKNPSREQVAGVAGYSPGSGGFNNLVGAMRSAGLIDSTEKGTICLTALQPEYEMSAEEAREMLLSVLSNPHKKIVAAFNGEDCLSRDEVAQRSGYSAGSGGFNNLVGKLNALNILERPSSGMLAISDWAREVLQE